VLTFAAGYILSRLLGADRGQQAALMFGLGMNNNGTGLVLASVALASRPLAMLPIIAYNLTQHLVAGCVHAMLRNAEPACAERLSSASPRDLSRWKTFAEGQQ
jgi:BASS family bile acid:Na+ symporter